MLEALKRQANLTYTENGAVTHVSSGSKCLDLFFDIGAFRVASDKMVEERFRRAVAENPDWAMKILFYGRDIRGGLGERKVFRTMLRWLAFNEPRYLRPNISLIPEYGRWDDVLALMGTPCEEDALALIRAQLEQDQKAGDSVSLLAKWLPSVNTSNREASAMGRRIARALHMTDRDYRKLLVRLREKIRILENDLRTRDYTFDYAKQPSRAMHHYRKAFQRNDGDRYQAYLNSVSSGEAAMHTGGLMPYDITVACRNRSISEEERRSLDVTWNALENFAAAENSLAVVDVSGSMFCSGTPLPGDVAVSLGIYFAERNTGPFHNHFITFSERPALVKLRGRDICEKVRNCVGADWGYTTNLMAVFRLILDAAVQNHIPQDQMPQRLYIISDMEFDCCKDNEKTNFDRAEEMFCAAGYRLPQVVFWNVQARTTQTPVTMNEAGVALVSGCTPNLFKLMTSGVCTPMQLMLEVLESERYALITVSV